MLFNSFDFLVFFPIVVILYLGLPKRIRYIWLLIASYFFYTIWYGLITFLLVSFAWIFFAQIQFQMLFNIFTVSFQT